MDLMSIEIVVIVGVVLDITSAYPYGEQRNWDGSVRRSNLRGVLLPRLVDLATLDDRRPQLWDDILPTLGQMAHLGTRRTRRRKYRLLKDKSLAKRQDRKPRFRDLYLSQHEQLNALEDSKYSDILDKKDIPEILKIVETMAKKDNRKLRRSKRGRGRRTRTLQRQNLIGNSDSMDTIDGFLSPHSNSQELSVYEQLSIELARLRCQELQRQRDALRVLEMADPSNFQHRSQHREQPC